MTLFSAKIVIVVRVVDDVVGAVGVVDGSEGVEDVVEGVDVGVFTIIQKVGFILKSFSWDSPICGCDETSP